MTDTPSRWKYVDDTTLGVTLNNTNPDYTQLQALLNTLHTWTTNNHITINANKSTVMHINTSTSAATVPPPGLYRQQFLQVVRSAKLLGVTIDDQLTWKLHVGNLVKSATYKLHLLRRLKTLGIPAGELAGVYSCFILPKLTYASPAWSSSLTLTQRRQLETVQKRACRLILGSNYTSYQDALHALKLNTLQDRHALLLEQMGRRLLHHPRHRDLLPPTAPRPRTSVRHANTLVPIRARTDRYKRVLCQPWYTQ
ncbi:uncharacterized protein LOC123505173 [Portunus trituberculatus]|uniref:uncharacterized protein LOC123505173 n=1 Tax=Portunus trituberculatus TaxID=210409 RepID=UPI001E1CF843|nr:uncharacterized protein LOC123505173 [Portunus trituberculatus]